MVKPRELANTMAWTGVHGLEVDAVTGIVFGNKEGYAFYIEWLENTKQYNITFSLSKNALPPEKEELKVAVVNCPQLTSFSVRQYKVNYAVKKHIFHQQKTQENVILALDYLIDFLKAAQFENCDEETGRVGETAPYLLDGTLHLLNQESLSKRTSELEISHQLEQRQTENVLLGIVGAFLGSILGVVLFLLIGLLGYIAMISGIVMGLATMKGYQFLGKKLSKKGMVISVLVVLIMTYVANRLDFALAIARETGWSFWEVYQELSAILDYYPDLVGEYIRNLLLAYAMSGVAVFYLIRETKKEVQFKHMSRKLSPFQ